MGGDVENARGEGFEVFGMNTVKSKKEIRKIGALNTVTTVTMDEVTGKFSHDSVTLNQTRTYNVCQYLVTSCTTSANTEKQKEH